MDNDESWAIAPVVRPAFPAGRRQRMIRKVMRGTDDHLAPVRQLDYRDDVVIPSGLDMPCRGLLRRAQIAVLSVLTSEVYVADLRAAMPVSVLNRHEWEVAVALREITELRANTPQAPRPRRLVR
jgi:hypothetical protein